MWEKLSKRSVRIDGIRKKKSQSGRQDYVAGSISPCDA